MKLIIALFLVFLFAPCGSVLPWYVGYADRPPPSSTVGPSSSVTCTWPFAVDKLALHPLLSHCPPGIMKVTFLRLLCISVLQGSFIHTEISLKVLVTSNIDDNEFTSNMKPKCFYYHQAMFSLTQAPL